MKLLRKSTWATTDKAQKQARRFQVLTILLVTLALGVQALAIYYSLTLRTVYHSSGVRLDATDVAVAAVDEQGEELGFQVGDRWLALDGQAFTTYLEFRRVLNRYNPGDQVYVTVQRGAETLLVGPIVVEWEQLDIAFPVRHLLALAFLAMGALVALQRPMNKAGRLFFLGALALGLYFALLDAREHRLVYLQIAALTLMPGLVIHFFLSFPQERRLAKGRWWFLIYVPSLLLMGLTAAAYTQAVAAGTGVYHAPWYRLLSGEIDYGYLALSATLGLASMGYAYATTPNPILKRQLQWIMWGLVTAIVISFVDIVLTVLQMQTYELHNLLLLGVIPLPVAFAFAILRYRLLDVDLVINRSAVYGLLTAILAALYLLLISVLSSALGVAAGSSMHILVVFLSAIFIGLLVNPLRARIQDLIDRTFFRRQIDFQRALSRWSEELNTSIRFSNLTRLLTQEVPQQLMIDQAWLLALNEAETRLEALPGEGDADADESPFVIPARSALAVSLARHGGVCILDSGEAGSYSTAIPDIPPTWPEAGARIVLPLVSGGVLVGVYLLGSKLSGDVYQRQELELLRTLSNQAAVAIANARLYEQVHALSQGLEKKVQERTQELRDFVSVVYHELSTPITAIRGYTELIIDGKVGPISDRQRRYLGTVCRNAQRLGRLVADLSDISRIEDGRLTLHPEPLRLEQVVMESVHALSDVIDQKGLQVSISLPPEVVAVQGDPQRVAQILTNLVSNACRYTPAGGQIIIAANRVNGSVEMTVRDTGIGIRQEEMDRIFDRFYRSSDPLVQAHPGTGLGLAITKSLVELHGSQLWVNSTVGKGSTFGFTLPLVEAVDR